jgi:hypothetical protein
MTDKEQAPLVPRAARFPIRTPLLYRESGAPAWREGVTVNMSHTGVLFDAEDDIPLNTTLEMRVVFSSLAWKEAAKVVCWGPVVRHASDSADPQKHRLAAAIRRYQLRRD